MTPLSRTRTRAGSGLCRLLATLPALLAIATGAVGTAASAQDAEIERRSGLPWASAAVGADVGFEAWRGRVLDARTMYLGMATWAHAKSSANAIPAELARGGRAIIAIGLVPYSHTGQIAQCAEGAFDLNIRELRDAMLAKGGRGAFLRPGWEFNRVNGNTYPWAAQGDGATWRDCFKRWVDILNPIVDAGANPPVRQKNFFIVWNVANQGNFPYPVENLWPGDGYVDVVGSQFYDRCPPVADGDLADWRARLVKKDQWGNPAGPLAWLAFAKAKGKRWAVPEWGIAGRRDECDLPGIDNPYFIRKMFELFQEHAADIAFEAYFNGHGAPDDSLGTHKLFAPAPNFPEPGADGYLAYVQRYNPNSAVAYRQLWGRGAERDELYWLRYAASANDTVTSIGTDVAKAQAHYETIGKAQGRSVLFDPWTYLARNPDLASILQNDPVAATRHYLTLGWREGRIWSGDKVQWLRYIASYKGLVLGFRDNAAKAELDYLTQAVPAGRGKISFLPDRYLNRYADVRALIGTDHERALRHFITRGYAEGRTWSADAGYWLRYVASNPKLIPLLKTRAADAEMHWHAWGKAQGLTIDFDPAAYLAKNPDIKTQCRGNWTCATTHYIENGYAAGRVWR